MSLHRPTAGRRHLRPPGPRGYPFVGVLPHMRRDSLHFLTAMAHTYGDIVTLPFGPLRVYFLCHPDHIAYVLQQHHRNYRKSPFTDRVRPLLGQGLATSEGTLWRTQRRLMQPAFQRARLAPLAETITSTTHTMLERWQALAAAGIAVDIMAEMLRLTGEVIIRAVFGTSLPTESETLFADFTTVTRYTWQRMLALTPWSARLPTLGRYRCSRALARLEAMIQQHMEARQHQDGAADDLLALLLAARDPTTGAPMTAQQVRDEVMTLVFAGHETTAVALTWTWYVLAHHPDVQGRVRREALEVFAGSRPTLAALARLPYTRMTIQEVLRLYPPAWILARTALADDVIGGYPIPAQTTVLLSPYVTHRHPTFWPNPERFDPQRFAPPQVAAQPPGAYVPFSAGPRACLGEHMAMMEMSLIVAYVVQAYQLTLRTGQRILPQPSLTLRPSQGVHLVLTRQEA
jgi:cytochrome P450